MTRIDFYVLEGADPAARNRFACRLADKAYQLGHQVYIHTESAAQTQQLDELLWTFRAGSFVPHGPRGSAGELPPVLLGHDGEPDSHTDVLINMAQAVPLFFSRFTRVAELVDKQPAHLQDARDRYRFYRERGYDLTSHNIGE